jgi:DNA polymerase-1
MPTLYLIDGYAQFFRAYHAIRTPMTSPVTKEPTNLTFGFLGMMLKLLRGEGQVGGTPDYVACVIDVSGDTETFRSTLYPDYKAHRPPPPEDLFPQVQRCLRTLEAIGVPVIGTPGFEADDAIATLVSDLRARHPDLRIRIISKDKDLKQLLTDDAPPERAVELYDIHTDLLIDAAQLKAETGLRPAQVIDMLALMGDNVDNVPGVEGVGPKTAAEMVALHGTAEAVIEAARAGKIKGKRGEKLAAAGDIVKLSRALVTLRHDAPVTLNLPDADTARLRLADLLPILKELGFNRYQDEVRLLLGQSPVMPAPGEPASAPAPAPPRAAPKASRASKGAPAGPSLFDEPNEGAPTGAITAPAGTSYRCCRRASDLDELLAELRGAPVWAIDTETTGLSPISDELCGISLSTRPTTGWYVPVRAPAGEAHLDAPTVIGALRPLLEDPARPKCGHNLKFDAMVLRKAGIELGGFMPGPDRPESTVFDSMVASYLLDATRSSHSLDALALALLGHTNIALKDLLGSAPGGTYQRTFDQVNLEQATAYAAEDADIALRLHDAMRPQLHAHGQWELFTRLEMPLVRVLAELEWNGVRVDPAELDRQRERLAGQVRLLREQIDDTSHQALGRTFNPDSPKQLAGALFNKPGTDEPGLGLKPVKRTQTGFSTDIEVLEKLSQDAGITTPIPRLIVEYRQLSKLVSTYLVALKDAINPRTGRVHASFNQTVAATGRLSSSDPNLQNIPIRTEVGRDIRRAFVAPPGRVLISADYSQIELRLLAHLSQDPALIEAFHQGQDIHSAVAAQVHRVPVDQVTREQRAGAKMVNFGIVYGITPYGLAQRLGCSTTEADEIITGYKKRFAGITTFLTECVDHAQRHGYVQTMMGRRRPIPEIDSSNPARRAFAERTAINTVVQGSAADLIKLAMVDLYPRVSGASPQVPSTLMLLQIHDELVFEAPAEHASQARELITSRMEAAMQLRVPLKADSTVATTWFDEE